MSEEQLQTKTQWSLNDGRVKAECGAAHLSLPDGADRVADDP